MGKYKRMLIKYFTPFILLWVIGTIIPTFALNTTEYPFITNALTLIFNPIGYLIRVIIAQVLNAVYFTEIIAFLLMTIGQFISLILYKFLSKKLFKINW